MSCNEPEQWGFAKNQVTPFFFDTPDHESLYAWHILPNGLYAQHEAELMEGPTGVAEDITRRRGFQLLQDDPNARLIISFHGNAGHVAQGWRPDLYRTLIQGSTHSFHVLAVDYRGYGYSTGSPDEKGLITDGIATVHWALNVAKIPPERIVIVGHSMGTAVTAATAEHFALQGIDFAGIIVVAPFSSMPKLLTRYTIGDLVAPLYPIEWIPWLHRRFADVIHEKWPSAERLANFMRVSTRAKLFIIGARNDYNIRYSHSDTIFAAAANATTDDMPVEVFEKLKEKSTVHTGHGGFISTWKASPEKVIQEVIFPYGGKSLLC
jgi:pimeloyl-ACP methyl ester carboxylesterase